MSKADRKNRELNRGNFEKHAGDRGRYAGGAENDRLTSGKA